MARESIVDNLDQFLSGLMEEPKIVDRIFSNRIRDVCIILHHQITSRTPVNTGKTLANYQWSINQPATSILEAVGTGKVEATNELALGTESRRPANQAVTDVSLAALNFSQPYQSFYLTNNNPAVGPLEDGEWPEYPFRQRSPSGMISVSMVYVDELLASGVL